MISLPTVELQSRSNLMTHFGEFQMLGYKSCNSASPTVVLMKGNPDQIESPLVRLHSKCATGESFGSCQCDCAAQLIYAMEKVAAEEHGIIIYLDQEARGNGLAAKLQIYQKMQEEKITSAEACRRLGLPVDNRDYREAAAILCSFGIKNIRLLTNNPEKIRAMRASGIRVQPVQIPVVLNEYNRDYLLEKQRLFGHDLNIAPKKSLVSTF